MYIYICIYILYIYIYTNIKNKPDIHQILNSRGLKSIMKKNVMVQRKHLLSLKH